VRDDFKVEAGDSLRIKNENHKKDEKDSKCEHKISSSKKLKSCLPKIFNQNNYSESESNSSIEKELVSSVNTKSLHSNKNFLDPIRINDEAQNQKLNDKIHENGKSKNITKNESS